MKEQSLIGIDEKKKNNMMINHIYSDSLSFFYQTVQISWKSLKFLYENGCVSLKEKIHQ